MKVLLMCTLTPTLLLAELPPTDHVYSVSPVIQYMEFSNEVVKGTCVSAGINFNYSHIDGYNLNIDSTWANGGKFIPNWFFSIKNTYNFDTHKGFSIHPIISLNYSLLATYSGQHRQSTGVEKAEIGLGLGADFPLLHTNVTLTPEIEVTREVSKYIVNRKKKDDVYWGWTGTKKNYYKASIKMQVKLTDMHKLELAPFYYRSFHDNFYNRGVKAAFVFNL